MSRCHPWVKELFGSTSPAAQPHTSVDISVMDEKTSSKNIAPLQVETGSKLDTDDASRAHIATFQCRYCKLHHSTFKAHYNHTLGCYAKEKQKTLTESEKEKTFICKYCGRTYGSQASLVNHYYTIHGSEYKAEERKLARVALESGLSIGKKLSNQHSAAYGTEFPCHLCKHSYWNKMSFRAHLKGSHPEATFADWKEHRAASNKQEVSGQSTSAVFACENCSAHFVSQKELEEHEVKEHGKDIENDREMVEAEKEQEQPPFKCKGCEQIFKSKKARLSHYKRSHRSNRKKRLQRPAAKPVNVQAGQVVEYLKQSLNAEAEDGPSANRVVEDQYPKMFGCRYCANEYKAFTSLYNHCNTRHRMRPKPRIGQFKLPEASPTVESQAVETEDEKVQNEELSMDISEEQGPEVSERDTENSADFDIDVGGSTTQMEESLSTVKEELQEIASSPIHEVEEISNVDTVASTSSRVKVETEEVYETEELIIVEEVESPLAQEKMEIEHDDEPFILDNPTVAEKIVEKSPLPLSAGIVTRAVQYPTELIIVWSESLEEDLISAVNMNFGNCILCIQELDLFSLPEKLREKMKKSQRITFTMVTSDDTASQWTVITGSSNCPNNLKNKFFRKFEDVEKVFSDYAGGGGKTICNMMRYSKDGLFPLLSQKLAMNTIGYNFEE